MEEREGRGTRRREDGGNDGESAVGRHGRGAGAGGQTYGEGCMKGRPETDMERIW